MSSAVHDTAAPASVPARAFLPGELGKLGELLDAAEGARIRLYVTPDGRLVSDGPRGAVTLDVRARIAAHKGATLRALRMAGAIGEAPRTPSAVGACHDMTHPRPPDYSYTLGRWVCVTCEPDVYALFVRAVRKVYDARTRAQLDALDVVTDAAERLDATAPIRLDRGPLMRELLAWGEAHDWPRLAYGWRTGAGADHRPYKWILDGAAAWRRFVSGNPAAELLAAQRAAAAYPATPDPDPAPSSTPSTHGAPASDHPTSNGAPDPTSNGAPAPMADPTLDAAPDPVEGAPRDWPEVFAVLDAGAVYLSRIGAHSEAGALERVELDDLTYPDSANTGAPGDPHRASARRLVAWMARERVTQLWVHPTWAAAAGLPMRIASDREMRDGIPHVFAEWGIGGKLDADALDGLDAGAWAMAGTPGRLAPWMKFYRKGASGTIAISVPHLDGRVPWRQAADGRELLAAILAYREALRRFAYRSGPGATSTALLRVVHRGSSAALDLGASMTPAEFPAPAHTPGLMPQWGWIRERTQEERECGRHVIGLDKNGMFLAASSSLRLGLDARPVHLDAGDPALAAAVEALTDWHTRPRPKRPVGYWLARVTFPSSTGTPSPLLPHPCYTAPGQADPAAGWQWYVSATLELCAELGAHVEAREAYLWPRESVHEPLEPWYQRLRDARAGLMREAADGAPGAALALAAVKATYTQGIGWLDASWLRKGEAPADLYRPDWRHAIHGTANANLWRNLARGLDASAAHGGPARAPFAILTDAAYYLTDNPDPLALAAELGLRMGEGLGQYKVKLAGLDAAELAPVWALLDAGRELGRVASEFASIINGREG